VILVALLNFFTVFKENSNDPPEADKARDVKWFNVAFEWRETFRVSRGRRKGGRNAPPWR